jgi:hypothetical protein
MRELSRSKTRSIQHPRAGVRADGPTVGSRHHKILPAPQGRKKTWAAHFAQVPPHGSRLNSSAAVLCPTMLGRSSRGYTSFVPGGTRSTVQPDAQFPNRQGEVSCSYWKAWRFDETVSAKINFLGERRHARDRSGLSSPAALAPTPTPFVSHL